MNRDVFLKDPALCSAKERHVRLLVAHERIATALESLVERLSNGVDVDASVNVLNFDELEHALIVAASVVSQTKRQPSRRGKKAK